MLSSIDDVFRNQYRQNFENANGCGLATHYGMVETKSEILFRDSFRIPFRVLLGIYLRIFTKNRLRILRISIENDPGILSGISQGIRGGNPPGILTVISQAILVGDPSGILGGLLREITAEIPSGNA